ncbi:MAG TPA: alpha/beta family hydrolase [Stellaceae bacterium]|nr:alpha/beta family hydrolase [Stellaceae bacterium]
MTAKPTQHRIETGAGESVTAIAYPAAPRDRAGVTLILGHGAGANQTSDFMVRFAQALAARGIDIVTFNFAYTEHRRRVPDRNDALEACYRRVVDAIRARDEFRQNALAIGGKSMGGRIASQIAAAGADPAALVLLGYPLHPPGKPDQLRVKHLPRIAAPTLIVQGSRDAFGTPDELRPILAGLKAPTRLFVVEGGDHSFKIPKRAGVPQATVEAQIQDEIARWLRERLAPA